MVDSLYTCSSCLKTYKKTRSNDTAMAEYKKTKPLYTPNADCDLEAVEVVCDDCYKEYRSWAIENGIINNA